MTEIVGDGLLRAAGIVGDWHVTLVCPGCGIFKDPQSVKNGPSVRDDLVKNFVTAYMEPPLIEAGS